MTADSFDLIIVGGGLRGCLLAIALTEQRPDVDFLLIDQAARLGGGAIDPYFVDQIPDDIGRLLSGTTVAEWESFYLALDVESRRVMRTSAMASPEQMHLEVMARVPAKHVLLDCAANFISDQVVLTPRGLKRAQNVINFTSRAAPMGNRLWCDAADFVFSPRQNFTAPILADDHLQVAADQGIAQYIPISPVAVTVRALTVARKLQGTGPTLSNMAATNKRVTSYPIQVVDDAIPELPGHPLLPSHIYDAAQLTFDIVNLRLRDRLDMKQCWRDIAGKWRLKYEKRTQFLNEITLTGPQTAWRSLDGLINPNSVI